MATNYPTSLDTLTNPVSNDSLNSPSHSAQHANANDAIEAIEAKLGIGNANQVGLYHITTATVTSAGSTIINNCFSSAYDNYFITFNASGSSGNIRMNGQLSVGGVTSATQYFYGYNGITSAGAGAAGFAGADSKLSLVDINTADPNQSSFVLWVHKPFLTRNTTFELISSNSNGSAYFSQHGSGLHYTTTSYDGIAFGPASGTFSGTFVVYGYRNSTA